MRVKKKRVYRPKEIRERSVYITEEQNKYLLDRSIKTYGQANKKSEVVRDILDIAMGVNPIEEGGEEE